MPLARNQCPIGNAPFEFTVLLEHPEDGAGSIGRAWETRLIFSYVVGASSSSRGSATASQKGIEGWLADSASQLTLAVFARCGGHAFASPPNPGERHVARDRDAQARQQIQVYPLRVRL